MNRAVINIDSGLRNILFWIVFVPTAILCLITLAMIAASYWLAPDDINEAAEW
jgi:hypothetical protein